MMPNLTRHDRVGHLLAFEISDEPPELADTHPLQTRGFIRDVRSRLFFDRGYNHLDAATTGSVQNEKWKAAVAGNQTVFHLTNVSRRLQCQRTLKNRPTRHARAPGLFDTSIPPTPGLQSPIRVT